jgi:hypothetical protein
MERILARRGAGTNVDVGGGTGNLLAAMAMN